MVSHRDRRTTKPVTRTPLRPTGYGGIGPSATLPLLDRWGDIDFVVAPRIRPNGARNAIPAGSCHGLFNFEFAVHGTGHWQLVAKPFVMERLAPPGLLTSSDTN